LCATRCRFIRRFAAASHAAADAHQYEIFSCQASGYLLLLLSILPTFRAEEDRDPSLEFKVSISLARNANLHARVFFPHIKRVAYYTILQQEEGRERRRGKTRGIYSYAKECEDRDGIVNDEWN